jgi:hypothetical protein
MVITQANRVVRNRRPYHLRTPPHCRPVGAAAWLALVEIGRVRPGQSVFVNGALGGVGPDALGDAAAIGLDPDLDYTQDVPASRNRRFDIVVVASGGLTSAHGNALTKLEESVQLIANSKAGRVRDRAVIVVPEA